MTSQPARLGGARSRMSSHAAEQVAVDPSAPPSAGAVAAPSGSPVWRRGAVPDDDARAVLAAVDRLTGESTRLADDAHRREPGRAAAAGAARGGGDRRPGRAGELLDQVEQLGAVRAQRSAAGTWCPAAGRRRRPLRRRDGAGPGGRRAEPGPGRGRGPGRAGAGRAAPGRGRDRARLRGPDAAGCAGCSGRCGTCSAAGSTGRCRCGTCGCCWTARTGCCPPPRSGCSACSALATRDGAGARGRGARRRHRRRGPGRGPGRAGPPAAALAGPEQRLLAAHDDLTYLVGDFAQVAAARAGPGPAGGALRGGLLESSHAARWAQRIGWTAEPRLRGDAPGRSRSCSARRWPRPGAPTRPR